MSRRLKLSVAFVATAAVATATVLMATTTPANAAGITNTITPATATAAGWYTEDTPPTYDTSVPQIDGLGQLKFNTPLPATRVDYYHNTGASRTVGVPWASVTGLSYSVRSTPTVAQAAYDLEVLTTGLGGYTTLAWEPYQNGIPTGDGTWHTYSDLEGGNWWSSHITSPAPGSQASPQPLSFFEALYPVAQVITYAIGQGSGNAGTTSYVDDVSFNGVTNNFEPNATDVCQASALHMQAPRAFVIAQANPAGTPCATRVAQTAAVNVVIVPGIAGVNANVGVAESLTTFTYNSGGITSTGQTDVASVVINAVGLHIIVQGLHAQAESALANCGLAVLHGSSFIANLTINGKKIVVGSAPLTIPLGLGVSLNLNKTTVLGNTVTQQALLLTGKTGAYRTAIAEAIAGAAC